MYKDTQVMARTKYRGVVKKVINKHVREWYNLATTHFNILLHAAVNEWNQRL